MERKIITPHLLINTPFAEKCDGNRLQISASQSRQALPLYYAEPAYVVTGYEQNENPDRYTCPYNAQVIFVSSKAVVIKDVTKDDVYDIITVYPEDKVLVSEGEYLIEGDVIKVKEHFFRSKELTQGTNLVCAIMSHPLGFEDAFVISESGAKKLLAFKYVTYERVLYDKEVLLSLKDDVYYPIPKEGDKFNEGEPFLRIQKHFTDLPEEVKTDKKAEVKDVTIVLSHKFKSKVREYYLTLRQRTEEIREKILSLDVPQDIKTKLINIHRAFKWKEKIQDLPEGVFIQITLKKHIPLQTGDKLTNRHAAKGVFAVIVPDEEMPELIDGRRVEILLNPMSIPSRMNPSQLFEITASRALYNFKKKLQQFVDEGKDLDEIINFIYKFYELMSENAPWIIEGVKKEIEDMRNYIEPEELLSIDWRFIAPPFESVSVENLEKMLDMVCDPIYFLPDHESFVTLEENQVYLTKEVSKEEVIDRLKELYPGIDIESYDGRIYQVSNFVTVVKYNDKYHLVNADYMYFYRLVHLSEDKFGARSMETYDLFGQPIAKKSQKTPQRFGEMEVWTLIAYDALPILSEFLRTKSDNHSKKLEYIYEKLTDRKITLPPSNEESLKVLKAYLYQIGLVLDIKENFSIDYYINNTDEDEL